MSVEDTVVAEAMSTIHRKAPLEDHSNTSGPVNQTDYGAGEESYLNKVIDIASIKAKGVGDYLKQACQDAKDVTMNLYRSITERPDKGYKLAPAYANLEPGYS